MAMSGQKTVTTAGSEEALGSGIVNGPLMVKAWCSQFIPGFLIAWFCDCLIALEIFPFY